jgi:hypothetical protein
VEKIRRHGNIQVALCFEGGEMLKFKRFPVTGPRRMSFKEAFVEWWFNLDRTFYLNVSIGLIGLEFYINILGNELNFKIAGPYRPIIFPNVLDRFFSWVTEFKISENKGGVIQIIPNHGLGIGIELLHSIHTDHAGFSLKIDLLLFVIIIDISDGRHWDYEKNNWEVQNPV